MLKLQRGGRVIDIESHIDEYEKLLYNNEDSQPQKRNQISHGVVDTRLADILTAYEMGGQSAVSKKEMQLLNGVLPCDSSVIEKSAPDVMVEEYQGTENNSTAFRTKVSQTSLSIDQNDFFK